jgi:hypothetical protein
MRSSRSCARCRSKIWLVDETEVPGQMAGLRPPAVPDKTVPVLTSQELPRLEGRAPVMAFRSAALLR